MKDISHEILLENLFDGVYYVDLDKRIRIWNKGAERITGFSKAEVIGACCCQNILQHIDDDGRELCIEGCPLTAAMLDGQIHEAEVYLHHKQGHRVPVAARISPIRDNAGNIIGGIEVFTDNSKALQILQELEDVKKEVYLDALTKVGNRRYGEMALNTWTHEWKTNGVPFGIIFLDIDHFKRFNDTFGHKTGDDVLIMVGNTIANILRRHETVVRWGGEEFMVVLTNTTPDAFKEIAERIRIFIERSFIMVEDSKLNVTASIGATLAKPCDTPQTIVQRADSLMYMSKTAGRNLVTMG